MIFFLLFSPVSMGSNETATVNLRWTFNMVIVQEQQQEKNYKEKYFIVVSSEKIIRKPHGITPSA
jgi:hypothetical protein